jgi:hypothetical protein
MKKPKPTVTNSKRPLRRLVDQVATDRQEHPACKIMMDGVIPDTDGTNCARFLGQYEARRLDQDQAIYALPSVLLDAITKFLPNWWSPKELEFERELMKFCQKRNALGIAERTFLTNQFVRPLPMPVISRELFDKLGWGTQMRFEQLGVTLELANERLQPLYHQGQSYLGWLLTNPTFLEELADMRRQRRPRSFRPMPEDTAQDRFPAFLDRWVLTGMTSWDLPIPEGPKVPALSTQTTVTRQQSPVAVELPITMPLPTRYPLRDMMGDVARQLTPHHLAEWREVVERKSEGQGTASFRRMFQVHFWLHYAIERRYPNRIAGHIEPLDKAFGAYLELTVDAIKKVRQAITKRLNTAPVGTNRAAAGR